VCATFDGGADDAIRELNAAGFTLPDISRSGRRAKGKATNERSLHRSREGIPLTSDRRPQSSPGVFADGARMSLERLPLIVVKRCYYDEFSSGVKTIEYRRHKGQFNACVFYPGRRVRIAYNYNLNLCRHAPRSCAPW
jgi:hypothetical protein